MNEQLRKKLLKPITPATRLRTTQAAINALERIQRRVIRMALLQRFYRRRQEDDRPRWNDPNEVRESVLLAKTMYEARQISRAEYVIFATIPIESLHESRCSDGLYEEDLRPISVPIDAVERNHGLRPDQYWAVADAPTEYKRLNREYERILDRKFVETLAEFGLDDLAALRRNNPRQFKRLRERGRRSVFHTDEIVEALIDRVLMCERDAQRAARANAYSAAITSIGAGLEGLLFIRCLKAKHEAVRVASSLRKNVRPRKLVDPTTWHF